ncbi:uncharacterized protein HMPREF1541_05111 [Cyphellophora europaea CBS 101466]|uniref:Bacteriophage T5 Orf172 DNA-binding domain-containing protein n=1 Tax=Cyphellophora europaea (strain CBS 101466) TaxID=1220924 RepID=W2RWE2_CYPE1|nr:uncharacterized protein HMPREF1541_05111 [Cyphellophora europaea CBS 101466]ETN40831.1 hypothetical protein HMPREF1541_05111 [Cyphellophora europaea CBS 101466]
MSFSGRTPESLLPRADSKNPATTCKGLTASGRPCRRALAASPKSSPVPSPSRNDRGVLAVLDQDDAAAFYCWQHKDQAESLAAQAEQRTTLFTLKEKSSIDTLADKVGVIDLDSEVSSKRKKRRSHGPEPRLTKRDTLPSGWHDMQGPLMTVPEEYVRPKPPKRKEYSYGRSNVKASWSCCIRADEDDPAPRPRPRPAGTSGAYSSPAPMQVPTGRPTSEIRRKPVPSNPSTSSVPASQRPPAKPYLDAAPDQPGTAPSHSQTQALLSLIPSSLSPQTTSMLLAELSKPISPLNEAGYIYIFWLTPDSAAKPDDETATSIIDDSDSDSDIPTSTRSRNLPSHSTANHHRQSETLKRYASVRAAPSQPSKPKRTVLLKIGRAANVHRRMSQWTKQCGQDITLVRYYPYQSSSALGSSSAGAKKCPHIHRVERLVHLELADQRVASGPCEACGREHKEWFEIEASRKGLRMVDKAVKRWVRWAAQQDRAGGTGVSTGGGAAGPASGNGGGHADVRTPEERARLRPIEGYY